jgi:sensor histidine kinase YesM
MKVRWRQHEMILVNIVFIILATSYFRDLHNTAANQYAGAFINNHVPFNLYRNVVWPDVGMGILIYCAYLLINLFTLRRFLSPKKYQAGTLKISWSFKKVKLQGIAAKVLKEYAWLLIQVALIIFFLGTALNIAIYYKHEWQFHYPGFSFFPKKGYNPNSMIDIGAAYGIVFMVMLLYFLYIVFRESIIHFIEGAKEKRAFWTLICNRVTITMVYYFALPVFLISFNIIHEQTFYPAYYLATFALFAMYMSNTYWLFPMLGTESFISQKIISRLLITSFLFSFPVMPVIHENGPVALLYAWMAQLFIITPLTWLMYQQQKDKILQLRGTEKALIKSNTDLKFLRSQINPHFLFNVLNTLYGTALQENAERTAEAIQKLGDMMRFMLHENNLDFIDMHKEVEYLENYIALQKLRTQSSPDILIEDNIDVQHCNYKIAPMLLIPFVENAFKHGISLKETSWIKIKLGCNDGNIFFEVSNSMHTRSDNDPEKERSGIGFKNVMQRLKLIYPGKHQLSVNGDEKEFFVKLSIQPSD